MPPPNTLDSFIGDPVRPPERPVYSVTELTRRIRGAIEGAPGFTDIWVRGEVSNYRGPHSSGALYFSIKDAGALINCAMFREAATRLAFRLEEGMKVLCRGDVSVYERRGQYQIVLRELKPEGRGDLYLAFEQLKKRLEAEGLFTVERKRPLPRYPSVIGVVTSPTGAAVQDILRILNRRWPGVGIVLAPVRVQGEGAAEDIAAAVRLFSDWEGADVLIVGRGGGSIEELWAFNEEVVARAIYDCRTPVVSAVGHETDFTIADFVADVRAPTPSAAAETVVPDRAAVAREVALLAGKMERALHHLFTGRRQELDALSSSLRVSAAHRQELERERLASLSSRLDALSPMGVLARGYAIAEKVPDGGIVKTISAVDAGDRLRLRVADGSISCSVEGKGDEKKA